MRTIWLPRTERSTTTYCSGLTSFCRKAAHTASLIRSSAIGKEGCRLGGTPVNAGSTSLQEGRAHGLVDQVLCTDRLRVQGGVSCWPCRQSSYCGEAAHTASLIRCSAHRRVGVQGVGRQGNSNANS